MSIGWVFVFELSGCGFQSCCSHLNFRYCVCFEQGIHWESDNCSVDSLWGTHVTWWEHTDSVKTLTDIITWNILSYPPFYYISFEKALVHSVFDANKS